MKTKFIAGIVLSLATGVLLGWYGKILPHEGATQAATLHKTAHSSARPIAYYQSSMHPWIKSPNPGRCTLCGMELVPVYEGDTGFAMEPGTVVLGSNSITALGVRTEPVVRGALQRSIRFAGVIDDDDSQHRILSAYVDGRIDQLHVHFTGAEVTAGQPLASVYSPMLLAAIREHQALHDTPASHPTHLATLQRLRQLGLANSQIDSLPSTFGPTNLLVEVLSPMTGTVVKRLVYAGQYVREGDPLFELADFKTMWFKFDAYERDLAWIQPGQPVEVTTPSIPGRAFGGSIAFIDPNLDPSSRSAKVRVELPNPFSPTQPDRRQFLHRSYAEARVNVEITDVLKIPRTAVLNPDGNPVVFIDRGAGAYVRTPLVLGRSGDESWEVYEGVQEGDAVVTHGNLLLDSQAQLAFSAASVPTAQPAPVARTKESNPTPSLIPSQSTKGSPLHGFLQSVDALRAALAEDNLAAYNARRPMVATQLEAFTKVADHSKWHEALAKLEGEAKLAEAPDLTRARQSFHAFNNVLLDSLLPMQAKDPTVAALKIYECPMTDSAFPGAPKNARWFQLRAPLQNPWFGKSMLTCGKEVRP